MPRMAALEQLSNIFSDPFRNEREAGAVGSKQRLDFYADRVEAQMPIFTPPGEEPTEEWDDE